MVEKTKRERYKAEEIEPVFSEPFKRIQPSQFDELREGQRFKLVDLSTRNRMLIVIICTHASPSDSTYYFLHRFLKPMKTPKNSKPSELRMIDHPSHAQIDEIEKDLFTAGTRNLDLDEILKQNQENIEKIKRAQQAVGMPNCLFLRWDS